MGTDVHLVVHGPKEFADAAVATIHDLEARWSRFLPDSDTTRLNEAAGAWVTVSPETVTLVRRGVEGHALTHGRFDPTVLGDLVRAGYDRSFDQLATRTDRPAGPTADLHLGADAIEIDEAGSRVRLAEGVGFDPGGIGKGLAADLVAEQVSDAGAAGVLVNLGGDLRAIGFGPDGDDWRIDIDPAATGHPVARVVMHEGALATSTTLRRRWALDGVDRHHLIDPASGTPTHGPVAATVLAARGWQAEILAKAILVGGTDEGLALVGAVGADALVVDADGRRHTTPGFARFEAPLTEGIAS